MLLVAGVLANTPPLSPPPPSPPPSSPPWSPPPPLGPSDRDVQLCNQLQERTGNYSKCARTNQNEGCDPDTLNNCNCVVIMPGEARPNATEAIREIDDWEVKQAWTQLTLSCLSLTLGGAYMACFLVWPKIMQVYPTTLTFWIYACDFVLTLQLLAVSALRIAYTWDGSNLDEPWPMTSDTACLCEFNPDHPGCKCDGGLMSFLLQAGLIGSIFFYMTMVHSLYRSVTDPFTRPASRLPRYLRQGGLVVFVFSVPYLFGPNEREAWGGYGYRRDNLMCWSPDRYGDFGGEPWVLHNPQAFITAIVPVSIAWLLGPAFLYITQRKLRLGGAPTRAMLQPRITQVRQSKVLVRVVSAYWLLTGAVYFLGWIPWGATTGDFSDTCEDRLAWLDKRFEYELHAASMMGANGTDATADVGSDAYCMFSVVMRNLFSGMLCLQGSVNALAGFTSNRKLLRPAFAEAYQRSRERLGRLHERLRPPAPGSPAAVEAARRASDEAGARRRGSASKTTRYLLGGDLENMKKRGSSGGGGGEAQQDISESLRYEVVRFVMAGIQQTTRATQPLPNESGGGGGGSGADMRGSLAAVAAASGGGGGGGGGASSLSGGCRYGMPQSASEPQLLPSMRATCAQSASRLGLSPPGPGPNSTAGGLGGIPWVGRSRNSSGAGMAAVAAGVPLLDEAYREVKTLDLSELELDGSALDDAAAAGAAPLPSPAAHRRAGAGAATPMSGSATGCFAITRCSEEEADGGEDWETTATMAERAAAAGLARDKRAKRAEEKGSPHEKPGCLPHLFSTSKAQRVVFKEYAPRVWQWLRREVYGVTADRYVAAMGEEEPPSSLGALDAAGQHAAAQQSSQQAAQQKAGLVKVLANFSEAKGGGFFFFSPDKQYMVKTMSRGEHRDMLKILPAYCRHMREQPSSLIARVSGVYSVAMYEQQVYFMVMDFLFWDRVCPKIHTKFDLKGSWVDRNTPSNASVRKDSDWGTQRLQVGAETARQLLRQCGLDAAFLAEQRLMDYSLLLGIHHVTEQRRFGGGVLPGNGGPGVLSGGPGSPRVPPPRGLPTSSDRPTPKQSCADSPRSLADALARSDAASASCAAASLSATSERSVDASSFHTGPLAFSAEVIEGPGLYRLGMIDILQRWDLSKRLERLLKTVFKCRCSTYARWGMSSIDPDRYARRFHHMVGRKLLHFTAEDVEHDWEAIESILDEKRARVAHGGTAGVGGSARVTCSGIGGGGGGGGGARATVELEPLRDLLPPREFAPLSSVGLATSPQAESATRASDASHPSEMRPSRLEQLSRRESRESTRPSETRQSSSQQLSGKETAALISQPMTICPPQSPRNVRSSSGVGSGRMPWECEPSV